MKFTTNIEHTRCKYNEYYYDFIINEAEILVGISKNGKPDSFAVTNEIHYNELFDLLIESGAEILYEKITKLVKIDTATNKNSLVTLDVKNNDLTYNYYKNFGDSNPSATTSHDKSEYNDLYLSLILKGWIDASTSIFNNDNTKIADISDSDIKKLIDDLKNHSTHIIEANYAIDASSVSFGTLRICNNIIDELNHNCKMGALKDNINFILLKLYTKIPRIMNNVDNYFIGTDIDTTTKLQDLKDIISKEQDLLTVLRTQLDVKKNNIMNKKTSTTNSSDFTYLTSLGLDIQKLDSSDTSIVKNVMGYEYNKFIEGYKVTNKHTQQAFDSINKSNGNIEYMLHGSRHGNILSILKDGLKLEKKGAITTAKMYGQGIYFTKVFEKAHNYTGTHSSRFVSGSNDEGYLLIFEVYLGNAYPAAEVWESSFKDFIINDLKRLGDYDSVYAAAGHGKGPRLQDGLINPEYVIYDEKQCTIKYIIKYEA